MRLDGERVREARRALGLSRAELAVAAGVSLGVLVGIEQNKHDPAAGSAYKIARTLDVPLDSLFTEGAAA